MIYRIVLYKDVIDYVIVEVLHKGKQYRYLALKGKLERYLNCKNLSFKTYDNHIKKMLNGKIIEKKGSIYCLTEGSRNKLGRGKTINTREYNWSRRPLDIKITDTIEDDNQYF